MSGDDASIPKVPAANVKSSRYILEGYDLYVLLIHDQRQKVKYVSCDAEDMEEKSKSRINNDLERLKEILKEKFKPEIKEIGVNDQMMIPCFEKELQNVSGAISTCPNVGAFLCVFLGFGGSEYVYLGREKEEKIQKMEFAAVVKHFNGENCKSLAMKPKMFFVQAETTSPALPRSGQRSGREEEDGLIRIPIQADIFVYFSSALAGEFWNEVPVTDTDKDNVMSRFVRLLCCELKELKPSSSIEIQKMVIRINFQIQEAKFIYKPPEGVDFLPLVTSQLTKDLFLADFMENPKANV
ncbi:caspase-3-like [Pecten maximus]|uniref:caspase-3-like n=1 Tax=Pecten maximus TaxID=6579 RepID=UPI0014586745|nr:caspase-3-like [Pecten maximus]